MLSPSFSSYNQGPAVKEVNLWQSRSKVWQQVQHALLILFWLKRNLHSFHAMKDSISRCETLEMVIINLSLLVLLTVHTISSNCNLL